MKTFPSLITFYTKYIALSYLTDVVLTFSNYQWASNRLVSSHVDLYMRNTACPVPHEIKICLKNVTQRHTLAKTSDYICGQCESLGE